MDFSGDLARTLLDLAPDPTVIVDPAGVIVFVNAQVEQLFGYAPKELIGAPIETLLPERFRDAHPEHRMHFSSRPKPRPMGVGLALSGLHKDGNEFPVEISLSPVTTDSGLLVVGAIRDATVRRDMEHQLVEANRAKSRLLAAASHDLRQPLQTLNLLNRAASRHAGENATLRSVLDRQQAALDNMSMLLASVLDISKLDSGAVVANPIPCGVRELLERLRSGFEPQAAEKGLTLLVTASNEACHTDPDLLRRLLGNLLSNAIRYTAQGSVSLVCVPSEAELRIEVRDTGIGIPAHELDRIFEEFYQVDHDAKRPEGLGLGLSIVRRLADLLHSSITVTSQPGQGTVFCVTLPRVELPVQPTDLPKDGGGAAGGLVLVIDDEASVADATSLLLELEGFDVRVASCEREALVHAVERRPDIIISDYHLRGGETGLGVVNSVRRKAGGDIPAIFVTGDTGRLAFAEAKIVNARVLSKPTSADDLLEAVRDSLRVQS